MYYIHWETVDSERLQRFLAVVWVHFARTSIFKSSKSFMHVQNGNLLGVSSLSSWNGQANTLIPFDNLPCMHWLQRECKITGNYCLKGILHAHFTALRKSRETKEFLWKHVIFYLKYAQCAATSQRDEWLIFHLFWFHHFQRSLGAWWEMCVWSSFFHKVSINCHAFVWWGISTIFPSEWESLSS